MGTLFVTGGAGFIGSNFVRYVLGKSQHKVVILDKLTYAGNLKNLEDVAKSPEYVFEQVDICDSKKVAELFKKHKPDALLNFAAETHVDRSIDGPGAFIQTNIVGVANLLEVTRAYLGEFDVEKKDAFRFLQVSTDEVYGSLGDEGKFSEETAYEPNSPYSASKAAADHLVLSYYATYGFPALITNCSNNYGSYQFPEKLIPLTILNALEAKELPIYGDGMNVRDWIYVEDHCEGIYQVLEKGRLGEKYNIGADYELPNISIVDKICETLERLKPAVENESMKAAGTKSYQDLKKFVEDRPGHDRRYAIDSSKISEQLGWKPSYTFEAALEKTVKWYLDHQDWCKAVSEDNYGRERLGIKN